MNFRWFVEKYNMKTILIYDDNGNSFLLLSEYYQFVIASECLII